MKNTSKTILLSIIMAMFLISCNMQNRFLYFPDSDRPSVPMRDYENMKLWHATTLDYQGLIAIQETSAPNSTIVLFHGNGGTALDREFYLKPFLELGFRVILAEYPGYGGRPGKVGEKPFVADGLETLHLAYRQYGKPLYLLGESLGCGVAAAVARQTSLPIAGIILITPWDTLASVAKSKFPFIPVKLFLTDKYDNIENLKSFKNKISIIGAEHDEIIPITHAINLYNTLPEGKKRMWIIKGAGHNDWLTKTDSSLLKEAINFIRINK